MRKFLNWLLVFCLAITLAGGVQAQADPPRAYPALLQMAKERPNEKVKIIVQRKAQEHIPEQVLQRAGGKITKDLPIINGFAMEIPARAVEALAKSPGVRWISLDAPMFSTQASNETVRDEFTNSSYSGNNGSANWTTDWVEMDTDGGGTSGGNIYIDGSSSNCPASPNCLRFESEDFNDSIVRSADLSNATSATLTYVYNATQFDTGSTAEVKVQVKDAGGSWQNLATFHSQGNVRTITAHVGSCTGDPTGSCTHDISPYRNTNSAQPTEIRIIVTIKNDNEVVYWDNFEIAYTSGATNSPTPTPTPTITPTPTPATQASPADASTVRDEFASRVYDNDDGSANWSSAWTEIDEPSGSGPTNGPVQVSPNSTYCLSPNCLRVGGSKANNPDPGFGVYRQADLSGAGSATLSYSYRRGTFGSCSAPFGTLTLDVSRDGGASWTTLKTYLMDSVDASQTNESFDISSYIAANTQIRFLTHGPNNDCVFFADNIQIAYAIPSSFVRAVGVDQLWCQASPLKGDGVTMAVIDSGIAAHGDLSHPGNGNSRIVAAVDLTSSPGGGDGNGHGTHVAGIIAGNGKATGGARPGLAPKASLIDVKVSNDQGVSLVSDVVAGLQWVHENKDTYNIRVVNLSLNSTVPESYHVSPLSAAIEILWFNGVTVVVAAGNNGDGNGPVTLYPPANDPFVITVGAVDDMGTPMLGDDGLTTFSAYGTTEDGFVKPDLVAPGRNIISLLASTNARVYVDHPAHRVDNNVFRMSGTSMATPVVSGAIALLLEDEPNLTPDQVKYRLTSTANTNWPGYDAVKAGAGTVDVYAAVQGTSTASANTGIAASQMLWTGDDPVAWDTVSWNSVSWNSVSWNSVSWDSVSWNSVSWNSEVWSSDIWDDEPVSASGVMDIDASAGQDSAERVNILFLPIISR